MAKKPAQVVLVPSPFQGHLTPMLQLGSILHSRGFSIAVVQTTASNSPDPSSHTEVAFLPLHVTLDFDGFGASTSSLLEAISAINAGSRAPFEELMMRMGGDVTCVVYDAGLEFVGQAAEKLKVPTMVIRGTSAGYVHSLVLLLHLAAQGILPLPESRLQDSIDPDLHPLRYKDLPMPLTTKIAKDFIDFQHITMDVMKSSSAVIWNTTDALDRNALRLIQPHLPLPFFSIGPLHKMAPPMSTTLLQEDSSCLSWLDNHPPNSVIYVSLGSLVKINETELRALAWGLAKNEQPFLWAIRPGLLNGTQNAIDSLPKDFMETTGERGCVVNWAPQKRVLADSAVGGFLTHCGWNSTLESMCEGVPMICRPCLADQRVNARYVSHVWRVGVELEDVAHSGSIQRGIRKVMTSDEEGKGKGIRRRALQMKQVLEDSITRGSSRKSLDQMVEFIASLAGTI